MRFVLLAFLLVTAGCEAVVHFDRSKIDGGAKSLRVEEVDLDGGTVETVDGPDAATD